MNPLYRYFYRIFVTGTLVLALGSTGVLIRPTYAASDPECPSFLKRIQIQCTGAWNQLCSFTESKFPELFPQVKPDLKTYTDAKEQYQKEENLSTAAIPEKFEQKLAFIEVVSQRLFKDQWEPYSFESLLRTKNTRIQNQVALHLGKLQLTQGTTEAEVEEWVGRLIELNLKRGQDFPGKLDALSARSIGRLLLEAVTTQGLIKVLEERQLIQSRSSLLRYLTSRARKYFSIATNIAGVLVFRTPTMLPNWRPYTVTEEDFKSMLAIGFEPTVQSILNRSAWNRTAAKAHQYYTVVQRYYKVLLVAGLISYLGYVQYSEYVPSSEYEKIAKQDDEVFRGSTPFEDRSNEVLDDTIRKEVAAEPNFKSLAIPDSNANPLESLEPKLEEWKKDYRAQFGKEPSAQEIEEHKKVLRYIY